MENEHTIEALLPGYFLGKLNSNDRKEIESWKNASLENLTLFNEYLEVWESMGRLDEMEKIDTHTALQKVTDEISKEKRSIRLVYAFQRIAAILILPLLAYVGYLTFKNVSSTSNEVAWQTITSKNGMRNEMDLPDGTHVWLNSGAVLQYPVSFSSSDHREVKITGEGFFKVTHDKKHPFVVNTGKMNVEVLGTSFNILNKPEDKLFEVVLETGKVNLFSGNYKDKVDIGIMKPGQRATYDLNKKNIVVSNVEIDKYLAWKEGKIMFRDDVMTDVAKRLGQWFNVKIIIQNPELNDYLFTATFQEESLTQILDLLKLSSPIEYKIVKNKKLEDESYSQTVIYIKKRR